MHFDIEPAKLEFAPLETVIVADVPGDRLRVTDGQDQMVYELPAGERVTFLASGSPGVHTLSALDSSGRELSKLRFTLRAATDIVGDGPYGQLLDITRTSMGGVGRFRWKDRTFRTYVSWLRDHVHAMKGMKYFETANADWFDLARMAQREDGMFWDFYPWSNNNEFFLTAYGPLGYSRTIDGKAFTRMPAENDVEYLYVDGLYWAWKADGDLELVKRNLDAAIKGLNYGPKDPARWSAQYQLLKRAYTIDTWDFIAQDQYSDELGQWGRLIIDPVRSKFGVMFGDNTGYALACEQLAEMLVAAGRADEAPAWRLRGSDIRKRLYRLSWNGRFFTHHVAEEPKPARDFGVDESAQVSLSNAYSVNRNIDHDKVVAIVRTYMGIRDALPPGSPGEWYSVYPPFQKGFSDDGRLWQYVNGGVVPLVAGELARGAFRHGFEAYGMDILQRMKALVDRHGGRIHFAYTGAFPPLPQQTFAPVSLAGLATMDLLSPGRGGAAAFMGAKDGDGLPGLASGTLDRNGVPFDVAPAPRQVVPVGVGSPSVRVPIGRKAATVYLLHTCGGVPADGIAARVTLEYEDGGAHVQYLQQGVHVSGWWFPERPGTAEASFEGRTVPAEVAWRGPNGVSTDVGLLWCALANPNPDRAIRSVLFEEAGTGAAYGLIGMTLGDLAHQVQADPISGGGPDNWSAAAVTYALVEGMAGVVDADVAFRKVELSPRWAVDEGVSTQKVCVHLPSSQGYVAYDFRRTERSLELTLAGSGDEQRMHVLLPVGRAAAVVRVDGEPVAFAHEKVEDSDYVDFLLTGRTAKVVVIELR